MFVSVIRSRNFLGSALNFVSVDASVGSDVHVGMKVQILSWLAVFAEYRHTRFDANWDDKLTGSNAKIRAKLATNHFQMGLGLHF